MQWCPVVYVLQIRLRPIENESLRDVLAFVRVLRKEIHDKVERSFAITIGLVNICSFLNECFDQPNFKFDHRQVKRTAVDATAEIYIHAISVDQHLCRFKLFISDSKAEWRAIVLV